MNWYKFQLAKVFLLINLVGMVPYAAIAQRTVLIDGSRSSMNIGKHVALLEDHSSSLTFNQILEPANQARFKQGDQEVYGFGITHSIFWYKLKVQMNSDETWYLDVDNRTLEEVIFYFSEGGKPYDSTIVGVFLPIGAREIKRSKFVFRLNLSKGKELTGYLKIHSRRPVQIPLFIIKKEVLEENIYNNDLMHGVYFGFLALIILYNLFIWFTERDRAFVYYVFYIASIGILVGMITDSFDFYFKDYGWAFIYGETIGGGASGIFAILFCIYFLHTARNSPVLHKVLLFLLVAYALAIVFSAFGQVSLAVTSVSISWMALSPVCLLAAITAYKRGFRPAIFYIIGWSVLLLCVAVFVLVSLNFVPYTLSTTNAALFGTAFEALMFSIALTNKISVYKKEKDLARAEMLTEALEKEKFKKMNSEVEMKALRSQMNPHFIFNSLHSINKYVMDNEKENASEFLTKFARLMRLILENSREQEVPLEKDLAALELYIQLEALRFQNKFKYRIEIDPDIDRESVMIPPMLLQPFVENSILHGLKSKDDGLITIRIQKEGEMLRCTVEDNGAGREQGVKMEPESGKKRESLALKITQERLHIISETKRVKTGLTLIDLKNQMNQPEGLRVELLLPYEAVF